MPNGKRTINDLTKLADIVTNGDLIEVGVGIGSGRSEGPLTYWARSSKKLSDDTIREIGDKIYLRTLPKPEYVENAGKRFYYEFQVREN